MCEQNTRWQPCKPAKQYFDAEKPKAQALVECALPQKGETHSLRPQTCKMVCLNHLKMLELDIGAPLWGPSVITKEESVFRKKAVAKRLSEAETHPRNVMEGENLRDISFC